VTETYVDCYMEFRFREGSAPVLLGKVTDWAQVKINAADISTIKATIKNLVTGEAVLNEVTLTKADVWFDTLQTLTITQNGESKTYTYNFKWHTLASYFKSPTIYGDCQFKIEVWVTPVIGEQCEAGWWIGTAKKSIVQIPE